MSNPELAGLSVLYTFSVRLNPDLYTTEKFVRRVAEKLETSSIALFRQKDLLNRTTQLNPQ